MIKQLKPEKILDMTINKKSKRLPRIEEIKTFIRSFDSMMFRMEYTKHSYYILTDDFMNKTVEYIKENNIDNIVEIGCGSGLLSYWLNKYLINNNLKINIISIDKRDESFAKAFKKSYFSILEEDGIKYIKNNKINGKTFYISSWPNYNTDFAFDILNNLKINDELLYIGEGSGGCTGNDKFHDSIDGCTEEKRIYTVQDTISFKGIHDFPSLFLKNKKLELNNNHLKIDINNEIEFGY